MSLKAYNGTEYKDVNDLYVHDGNSFKKCYRMFAHDGTEFKLIKGTTFKIVSTVIGENFADAGNIHIMQATYPIDMQVKSDENLLLNWQPIYMSGNTSITRRAVVNVPVAVGTTYLKNIWTDALDSRYFGTDSLKCVRVLPNGLIMLYYNTNAYCFRSGGSVTMGRNMGRSAMSSDKQDICDTSESYNGRLLYYYFVLTDLGASTATYSDCCLAVNVVTENGDEWAYLQQAGGLSFTHYGGYNVSCPHDDLGLIATKYKASATDLTPNRLIIRNKPYPSAYDNYTFFKVFNGSGYVSSICSFNNSDGLDGALDEVPIYLSKYAMFSLIYENNKFYITKRQLSTTSTSVCGRLIAKMEYPDSLNSSFYTDWQNSEAIYRQCSQVYIEGEEGFILPNGNIIICETMNVIPPPFDIHIPNFAHVSGWTTKIAKYCYNDTLGVGYIAYSRTVSGTEYGYNYIKFRRVDA